MRIGIFGVAGFNRGDDAISKSLCGGFRAVRPDLVFVVPVLRPGRLSNEPAVETFLLDRRSIGGMVRLAAMIRSVDAVVIGGGSLVQDRLGGGRIRGILGYAWTVTALSRLFRRPIITAPIGVDELRSSLGMKVAREILGRTEIIAVRDAASARVARTILGDRKSPQIRTYCDPVFGWSVELGAGQSGTKRVVLSPAFEGRDEEKIYDIFVAIVSALVRREPGISIELIAMDERLEEDGGKVAELRNRIPPSIRDNVMIYVPTTPEDAARCIRSSVGVIAMRLHALIMGYGYVNLYCLSRTTKTDGFMEDYLVPGCGMEDNSDIIAQRAVEAVLGSESLHGEPDRARLGERLSRYYAESLAVLDAAIARA